MTDLQTPTLHLFWPIDDILVEERHRQEYTNIEELAEQIKQCGLMNPITVEALPSGSSHGYRLLAGGRRLKACTLAGLTSIPVCIYPVGLSDFDRQLLELTENIGREELTWHEETLARAKVHKLFIKRKGPYVLGSIERGEKKGHTVADTAKILKLTGTQLHSELELADYVEKLPALRNCENRAEARALIKKLYQQHVNTSVAKAYEEKTKDQTEDDKQKALIDSYVIGDFFEKTEGVENAFDFLEIDPPYGVDITDRFSMPDANRYVEVSELEYTEFINRLATRAYTLLKDNRWLICWACFQWYEVIRLAFNNAGFQVATFPAAWIEDTPVKKVYKPNSQMLPCYDPFFYCRKGDAELMRPGRKNIFIVPPIPITKRIHPLQRPAALLREIYSTFIPSGSSVCVPFAGSGVSLATAHAMKMSAIGYDLSQAYKDAFTTKILEAGVEWE